LNKLFPTGAVVLLSPFTQRTKDRNERSFDFFSTLPIPLIDLKLSGPIFTRRRAVREVEHLLMRQKKKRRKAVSSHGSEMHKRRCNTDFVVIAARAAKRKSRRNFCAMATEMGLLSSSLERFKKRLCASRWCSKHCVLVNKAQGAVLALVVTQSAELHLVFDRVDGQT